MWSYFIDGAAVLSAAAAILDALEKLGFDVKIFGRKKMIPEIRPITSNLRSAWTAIVLSVMALILAGVGFYRSSKPRTITQVQMVTEPYQYAWQGDKPPSKQIIGKYFHKEKVYLDDTELVDCHYEDVTFVYNGTAPFFIRGGTSNGHYDFSSDNPSINATGYLLSALNLLRVPFLDPRTGKPPTNIEIIRPKPHAR